MLEGYEAARERAAVFAVDGGARFRVTGPDAQDYLHRMLTNDINGLSPGRGAYACMLDINGRMLSDLFAWVLDPEEIMVECPAARREALAAALDRTIIMERVEIEDAPALGLLTVQGPRALAIVAAGLGAAVPDLAPGEAWQSAPEAEHLVVGARNRADLPGADVYVAADRLDAVRGALIAAGAEAGSAEALETLRVEAGIPAWGAELDENTIPLEANLEGVAVSFSKGCYPGQEIIARIHSRGRPARRLMGLRLEAPVRAGEPVLHDGKAAGIVTSTAVSPRLGAIALAYLKKDHDEPGAQVTVAGVTGETAALPFA